MRGICVLFLGLLYTTCLDAVDACVCVDYETVPVMHEACGDVMYKEHTYGACWLQTGQTAECDGSIWLEVDYGAGRTAWIDRLYLIEEEEQKCNGSGGNCEDVVFVSREDWGARPPRQTTPFDPPMSMVFVHHTAMPPCFTPEDCVDMAQQVQDLHMDGNGGSCEDVVFVTREEWGARSPVQTTPFDPPMSMVFVHHTAGIPCFTPEACVARAQQIQDLHMDTNGWDDVGYSFMVGQDGRVYEGRGWENQPAQARGHNTYAYGICIMGDLTDVLPVPESEQAVKDIIDCGIQQGYVTVGHEEFGHRDGVCTACPGDLFYPELQTWPRYSFRDIPVNC